MTISKHDSSNNNQTHDQRLKISRVVMGLLQDWGVSTAEQLTLLAMPEGIRTRSMQKYSHDTPLPDESNVNERIDHILGIADALRTSFPLNEEMGSFWLNRPNKRFAKRKPLEIMVNDGLAGILSIRVHLDCAYDWHIDSKSAE